MEEAKIMSLPEGCIANVLSFTSPREACYFSLTSSMFKNASLSDTVWERFLPPDYHSIISQSSDPDLVSAFPSKKDLFLRLCDAPIIIDDGKKSLQLDKSSGKKCYMLSSKDLRIIWSSTPKYWKWNSDPNSRFGEVAELVNVCWLEISGKISTNVLSPSTLYSAYLVFKLTDRAHGLDHPAQEARVVVVGENESEIKKRVIKLDPSDSRRGIGRGPFLLGRRFRRGPPVESMPSSSENEQEGRKERGDGWMEIELGEFFNKDGNDDELEISVLEVKGGDWKSGLVVEGIEIRPKSSR